MSMVPALQSRRNQIPFQYVVIVGLMLVTAAAVAVRLLYIQRGLWMDELASAWVVRDGLKFVAQRAWHTNQSPLYFFFVAISKWLFGYNEFAIRLPSLLAAVISVPAAYALGRSLTRSQMAGMFAAVLVAFGPYFVFWTVQVRPYAFVILFAILQVHAFFRLKDHPSSVRGAVYALFTVGLIYAQVTSVLLLVPEILYAGLQLWWTPKSCRRFYFHLGLWLFVAALLCLPLLQHILYLAQNEKTLGSMMIVPKSFSSLFRRFLLVRYLILPLVLAMVTEIVMIRHPFHDLRARFQSESGIIVFVFLWYFIPNLLVWGSSALGLARVDFDRYVAVAALAPALAAVVFVGLFKSRVARAVLILSCLFLVHQPGPFHGLLDLVTQNNGWREAVKFINVEKRDDLPVFIMTPVVERHWLKTRDNPLLRGYLLCPVNSIYPLRRDGQDDNVLPLPALGDIGTYRDLVLSKGGLWLIFQPDEKTRAVSPSAMGLPPEEVTAINDYAFKNVLVIRLLTASANAAPPVLSSVMPSTATRRRARHVGVIGGGLICANVGDEVGIGQFY